MKLEYKPIEVERSGDYPAQTFGFGDERVLFEILRGKMYKDPLYTLCQEVMSNAKDAHTEVDKQTTPIEVKLPNKLDPTFWVRDHGPGINNWRMNNICLRYGNSTKRHTNSLIGGYGLGFKSPFSYGPTFVVVTVCEEEEDGKVQRYRRQYLASIDETGKGEMTCQTSDPTEDTCGTTIIVTARPEDFTQFSSAVRKLCRYWETKPLVNGVDEWEWDSVEVAAEGEKWFMLAAGERDRNYHRNQQPSAIIGEIPYPIELDKIRDLDPDGKEIKSGIYSLPIRLVFDSGEIPVTATREAIDYNNPRTAEVFKEALIRVSNEIIKGMQDAIDKCETLRAALTCYRTMFLDTRRSFTQGFTWRGIKLGQYCGGYNNNQITLRATSGIRVRLFHRAANKYGCALQHQGTHSNYEYVDADKTRKRAKAKKKEAAKKAVAKRAAKAAAKKAGVTVTAIKVKSKKPDGVAKKDGVAKDGTPAPKLPQKKPQLAKKVRQLTSSGENRRYAFAIDPTTLIVEDDLGKRTPSRLRLATIFDEHPGVQTVAVVDFFDCADEEETKERRRRAIKRWNYHLLEPVMLSSASFKKLDKAPVSVKKINLRRFSYTGSYNGNWTNAWEENPVTTEELANIEEAVFVVYFNRVGYLMKESSKEDSSDCRASLKGLGHLNRSKKFDQPIYGVNLTDVKRLPVGWVPLLTYIRNKSVEIKKNNNYTLDDVRQSGPNGLGKDLWELVKSAGPKLPPNSEMRRFIETSKHVLDNVEELKLLELLIGVIPEKGSKRIKLSGADADVATTSLHDLLPILNEKYPLIFNLDHSNRGIATQKRIAKEVAAYINWRDRTKKIVPKKQQPDDASKAS